MTAPQSTTPTTSQTTIPELTQQWLHDKRIVVFYITSVTRPVVDAYTNLLKETMANWPKNQLFLALYDHSSPSMHMTPYVRQAIRDLTPLYPDVKGFTAIIAASRLVPIAQIMIRLQPQKSRQPGLFRTRDEGLKWLESKLPQH